LGCSLWHRIYFLKFQIKGRENRELNHIRKSEIVWLRLKRFEKNEILFCENSKEYQLLIPSFQDEVLRSDFRSAGLPDGG
jgi:hypothetical protein